MDAIVYTSNTGFTAQYAALLGDALHLPVLAWKDAEKTLQTGAEIIYLGWIMASQVKGFQKAAKKFSIAAVCGVGMGACGTQIEEIRKANPSLESIPLFTLQGGFSYRKLRGIYRLMMGMMKNTLGKKLASKPDRTPEESDMLSLLQNGGNRVSAENLLPVIHWYEEAIR